MQTHHSFETLLKDVLSDPATRRSLRDMILTALQRDPLDALVDAERLTDLLRKRFVELCTDASTTGRSPPEHGRNQHPPGMKDRPNTGMPT